MSGKIKIDLYPFLGSIFIFLLWFSTIQC